MNDRYTKNTFDSRIPRGYIYYYILLFLMSFVLIRPNVQYNEFFRFAYLAIVTIPLFKYVKLSPFVITAFYWISFCSFTALFPFSLIYTLLAVMLLAVNSKKIIRPTLLYVSFFIYFFAVSLAHDDFKDTGVVWESILIVSLLSAFIKTKEDLTLFLFSFVCITFIVALLFLLYRSHFMYSYMEGNELVDRSSWMNPNDLGSSIACGCVAASGLLSHDNLKSFNGKIIVKVFLISTLLVGFMALILNASRGSLAAAAVGSLLFVFLSKDVKFHYKIGTVILGVSIVYILYKNAYFDLLEARVNTEIANESGGGRYDIWEGKFKEFIELPVIKQYFGVGQTECINIGRNIRTHNDFVTALISYGYLGFLLFVIFILRPIIYHFRIKKFILLLPFITFLMIECNVLEPLFRGYYIFWAFLLFVFKYAQLIDRNI